MFFLAFAEVSEATTACLPSNEAINGFTAKFYQYNFGDTSTFSSSAYMAYGYANRQLLHTESGITDILIAYGMECQIRRPSSLVVPTQP